MRITLDQWLSTSFEHPQNRRTGISVTGFGSFKLNPLGPVLLTISHTVEVGGVRFKSLIPHCDYERLEIFRLCSPKSNGSVTASKDTADSWNFELSWISAISAFALVILLSVRHVTALLVEGSPWKVRMIRSGSLLGISQCRKPSCESWANAQIEEVQRNPANFKIVRKFFIFVINNLNERRVLELSSELKSKVIYWI